jgi:hypothetical protein
VQEKAEGALVGEIGRSDPRFAVAAPMAGTAEDRSGDAALHRMQRAAAPYGRPACLLATKGPMVTPLGACAGLGRSAWQGEARNRPTVQGATRDR